MEGGEQSSISLLCLTNTQHAAVEEAGWCIRSGGLCCSVSPWARLLPGCRHYSEISFPLSLDWFCHSLMYTAMKQMKADQGHTEGSTAVTANPFSSVLADRPHPLKKLLSKKNKINIRLCRCMTCFVCSSSSSWINNETARLPVFSGFKMESTLQ